MSAAALLAWAALPARADVPIDDAAAQAREMIASGRQAAIKAAEAAAGLPRAAARRSRKPVAASPLKFAQAFTDRGTCYEFSACVGNPIGSDMTESDCSSLDGSRSWYDNDIGACFGF